MPNRLYVGPFGPLFEESFLSAISAELKSNPFRPKVVLVGSNLLGLHLKRLLAIRNRGHFNVRFIPFVDLARKLMEPELQASGRTLFLPHVEELMIEDWASRISPKSRFYEVSQQEGFFQALKTTFHDLIDGGVPKVPPLNPKVAELSDFFRQHRLTYTKRFLTTADLLSEAASFAKRYSEEFRTPSLYCYGFYDLTEVQRRLLRSLAQNVEIWAWIPRIESSATVFDLTHSFFSSLGGTKTTIPASPKPVYRAMSAPSEYAEAEELARELLSLTAKDSFSLHEAGILIHGGDGINTISDVLERSKIPHYREGGQPLLKTSAGRAAETLLNHLGGEWTRQNLLDFLDQIPVPEDASARMGDPTDWDRWSRDSNATRGLSAILRALQRYSPFFEGERTKFSHFLTFLQQVVQDIRDVEENVQSWARFQKALLHTLTRHSKPTQQTEDLISALQPLSIFDLLGVPKNLQQACRITKRTLDGARQSVQQIFQRDGLFVGSLTSSRALLFSYAYVPGLAERSFPAPMRPDPLLLDHEREELNAKTGGGLTLKRNRIHEERALFEMVRLQARREVTFSYPRYSAGQSQVRSPSSFLLSTIGKQAISQRPLASWHQDLSKPVLDRFDWLSRDIGWQMSTNPKATFTWISASSQLAPEVDNWVTNRLGSSQWSEFEGMLKASERPKEPAVLSASDISTWATCPYQYFLSKVLRLKALDMPETVAQLRAKDRGTLVHQILFLFFKELKAHHQLPLEAKSLKDAQNRLKKIAEEILEKAEAELPLGHRLLWQTERSLLLNDLFLLVEREFTNESAYIPFDFEVRFGLPSKDADEGELSTDRPLEVKLGQSVLRLCGRIDRIDLTADGARARVVDYKTGSLENDRDDSFSSGRSIQLPLYLAALSLLVPKADLAFSEGRLLSTRYSGGFREVTFSGRTLEARYPEFLQILKTVTDGVQQGMFIPNPGKEGKNCQSCDFVRVCGKTIGRVFEKKKEDGAAQPFMSLQEIE